MATLPASAGPGLARRLFLVAGCAVAFSLLFRVIHLPAAWLLGSLTASALFSVRGWGAVSLSKAPYAAAQAIIGTALAGGLPAGVLPEWGRHAGLFALAVLFILAASFVNGVILARWTGLSPLTAFLSTLPGGAGAMAAMSDDLGSDTRVVAAIQYIRILLILASLAVFSSLFGGPSHHGGAGGPFLAHGTFSWTGLALSAALALAGWTAAMRTPLPAAAFLVPVALGLLAGYLGLKPGPWPGAVLAGAYIVMGLRIGSRFQASTLALIRSVLPAVLGTTTLLLLASAALAWIVARGMGIDLPSAYLAATPGGLDAVAAVASDLHGDVSVIVAMQFARLLCVLALGPWLARGGTRFLTRLTSPTPASPRPRPRPRHQSP